MIATHNIKYNGVWYKAGEEIKEVSSPIIETTSEDMDDLFGDESVTEVKEEKKTTRKKK